MTTDYVCEVFKLCSETITSLIPEVMKPSPMKRSSNTLQSNTALPCNQAGSPCQRVYGV